MIQVLPELHGGDELTYEPTIFRHGSTISRQLVTARALPAPYYPDESVHTGEYQTPNYYAATAVPTLRTQPILPPDYHDPGALEQLGELLNPLTGSGLSPANVHGFFAEDIPKATGETVEFAKDVGSAALDLAPLVLMGVMMMVMNQVKR